ncbi:MAG TPA: helix-turn-helix transcriptional regulator [Pseudonocardiaceae bacterium]|nr:helix-turn-helix transcriptional regulator [Pseudonocardiaceae bacterium]
MARDGASDAAWPLRVTSLIGGQIKRHRQGRITARELADRCEQLGHRVETQVIANMEAGRRTNVSAAELIVLAEALDVPTVALLFPVGEVAEVEALPGDMRDTWDALRRFTGEPPQTFPSRERSEVWRAASEPLRLYRQHQRLLSDLDESDRRKSQALTAKLGLGTESEREAADKVLDAESWAVRHVEARIKDLRQRMRDQGITPPPLSERLAYLDPEEATP